MTEKGKDKIITISASFITSIIVVLVSFGLNGSRIEDQELKDQIKSKVDYSDFDIHVNTCEKKFEKIELDNKESLKLLKAMNENIIELKTDLKWLEKLRENEAKYSTK